MQIDNFLYSTLYREALVDADLILQNNRALNPNKNFSMTIQHQTAVAYHVKGDALYNLGNFEHALVNYHRANKYTLKRVKYTIEKKIALTQRTDNLTGQTVVAVSEL